MGLANKRILYIIDSGNYLIFTVKDINSSTLENNDRRNRDGEADVGEGVGRDKKRDEGNEYRDLNLVEGWMIQL